MAEARCLRAMYYFEISTLVWECSIDNQYCSIRQHPSTFTQADPADVYKIYRN